MGTKTMGTRIYREQAEIEKYAPPIQYGKLKGKPGILSLTHKCKIWKPNIFHKLHLKKRLFAIGDLYRCSCGKIYLYVKTLALSDFVVLKPYKRNMVRNCGHNCILYCDFVVETDIEYWKLMGGIE